VVGHKYTENISSERGSIGPGVLRLGKKFISLAKELRRNHIFENHRLSPSQSLVPLITKLCAKSTCDS
jgi:hypothetical protein